MQRTGGTKGTQSVAAFQVGNSSVVESRLVAKAGVNAASCCDPDNVDNGSTKMRGHRLANTTQRTVVILIGLRRGDERMSIQVLTNGDTCVPCLGQSVLHVASELGDVIAVTHTFFFSIPPLIHISAIPDPAAC